MTSAFVIAFHPRRSRGTFAIDPADGMVELRPDVVLGLRFGTSGPSMTW